MISHLRGTVLEDGVVETSDGVGYAVTTVNPLPTGETVSLHIIAQFREPDISLWGFKSRQERQVFLELTKVQGVGPAIAMAVLQVLGVDGLARAVEDEDAKAFKPVPGVGGATAKRLLATVTLPDDVQASAPTASREVVAQAAKALTALGYPAQAVDEVLQALAVKHPNAAAGHLVQHATTLLAQKGAA